MFSVRLVERPTWLLVVLPPCPPPLVRLEALVAVLVRLVWGRVARIWFNRNVRLT